MKAKQNRIENAWRSYYSVSHSEGMTCGNMICHKCQNKIKGNYLIEDKSNFLLRGNEND